MAEGLCPQSSTIHRQPQDAQGNVSEIASYMYTQCQVSSWQAHAFVHVLFYVVLNVNVCYIMVHKYQTSTIIKNYCRVNLFNMGVFCLRFVLNHPRPCAHKLFCTHCVSIRNI